MCHAQLQLLYGCTGTGTTIRTPNFKLDFFQEQRLLEEKNDIGTKITMLNLLPGQVLHFPAKGTYWIFIPKSVRKKKWSTKCTPTYLDFSFKVIVSCEFWALDVLDEVTTSLTYVFHRKTATFCMFFFNVIARVPTKRTLLNKIGLMRYLQSVAKGWNWYHQIKHPFSFQYV